MESSSARQALHQCTVVNIDNSSKAITAFYNPNKIRIGKTVPWQGHASAQSYAEVLEFTGAKNQTLSVDLFFDGYEAKEAVSKQINLLLEMTQATIPVSAEEAARIAAAVQEGQPSTGRPRQGLAHRPPFVMLVWGEMPVFKGVISSINTEYSLFLPNGKPVRATCSLSLTEVHTIQMVQSNITAAERYRNERVRNRST